MKSPTSEQCYLLEKLILLEVYKDIAKHVPL